jgi:hypothetical protein
LEETGLENNPVISFEKAGIDKNLAHLAGALQQPQIDRLGSPRAAIRSRLERDALIGKKDIHARRLNDCPARPIGSNCAKKSSTGTIHRRRR